MSQDHLDTIKKLDKQISALQKDLVKLYKQRTAVAKKTVDSTDFQRPDISLEDVISLDLERDKLPIR